MIHTLLKRKKVILASASPRRKEIFRLIGIKALQMPAFIDESITVQNPIKLVKEHSFCKAEKIGRNVDSDCLVVAADTIVFLDKKILGKPPDTFQAIEYLTNLSGKFHYVYTGIALNYKNNIKVGYEKTGVEFHKISTQEIDDYLKTKEPFDKAGAYGIQGYGSQFIRKISGCYFNVMGFPISLFYSMLKELL